MAFREHHYMFCKNNFSFATIMVNKDVYITTEMVEYETYLTSATSPAGYIGHVIAVWWITLDRNGCIYLFVINVLSVTSANIAISHTLLKNKLFSGLHFCR